MSSVSNCLYSLTLPLVSVMRVIYRKIRHARYLYIKTNVEKVWGARYTLGARYLSKNTVLNSAGDVTGLESTAASHAQCASNYTIRYCSQAFDIFLSHILYQNYVTYAVDTCSVGSRDGGLCGAYVWVRSVWVVKRGP